MPFEFGDIVLVPFPFTDQTTSKRRPAVIVSSRPYNSARPDIVVMAVTSQVRPTPAFGEVWINQWQAAGLLKPSAIKPVFATLE
jgi:mRNA interferase MazF